MLELGKNVVALVTPLDENKAPDFQALDKLLQWHENGSTSAVILLGSTGEGTLFSEQERHTIIDHVINQSSHQLPVWVGCSAQNPKVVLAHIQQAEEVGAGGVMVSNPMYVNPSQTGLISYYTYLAENSELPIMMYNVPKRTGSAMDPETACILSHQPQIAAIKDADINVERMGAYQSAATDFMVYCGDDKKKLTCLANGGAGVVSVVANVLPDLAFMLCELASQGAFEKAQAIESKWMPLLSDLAQMQNPTAIKWILADMGLISPFVRMPLSLLTFDEEAKMRGHISYIKDMLKACGSMPV